MVNFHVCHLYTGMYFPELRYQKNRTMHFPWSKGWPVSTVDDNLGSPILGIPHTSMCHVLKSWVPQMNWAPFLWRTPSIFDTRIPNDLTLNTHMIMAILIATTFIGDQWRYPPVVKRGNGKFPINKGLWLGKSAINGRFLLPCLMAANYPETTWP